MKICAVCNVRWGEAKEGEELQIVRCREHVGKLSSAEIEAMGLTAGTYQKAERMKLIRAGKRL